MSVMLQGQMGSTRRSLHGTPIEFRIAFGVAFAGAVIYGVLGGFRGHGSLVAESREVAWNLALNTIPQTPFG